MKLKMLVASLALAYGSAGAQTATWETAEYFKSRTLQSVNASTAYSRGYTGKGSKIAILDSGIDTKNVDFQNGKILLVKDFTNSGSITDTIGHGTHVAGIAAASRNGIGVQGVAFDANLLIGKITTSGIVAVSAIPTAIQWASSNGADVANLSLNFTLTQSALKANLIAPGVYSTMYTNTGALPGGLNAAQWASAMGAQMVLVVAAGNDGTPWSGGLATLSYTTDSKGNLVLGGRMIVAGNWNEQTNTGVGPGNNGAATLCLNMVANVCQDKYKLSDFYLLAPGTGITSTVPTTINSTGLANMTGTSMAAPAIAGGVAIIRQMWPQMTGANIVKLLLVTANKNIPGYDPIKMGQGLMDLDKATRPVGTLGIATTGRLSGTTTAATSALLTTSGSASTGKVTNLMLIDGFDRDFYVKGKALTAYRSSSEYNLNQNLMAYASKNAYSQFNNYTDYVNIKKDDVEIKVFRDRAQNFGASAQGMIEATYNKDYDNYSVKFTGGTFNEANTWLGNSVNSLTSGGVNDRSSTSYVGLGLDRNFGENTHAYANIYHGVTFTGAHSDNIKKIGTVMSYTWSAGLEHNLNKQNKFGVMMYQPVTVYRAQANLNIPVGLDSEYKVIESKSGDLAATVQELRTGLYYKLTNDASGFMAFVENRHNYRGQEGVKDNAVGITFNKQF